MSVKHYYILSDAGWSSQEARRAHNPKVIGSNPIPATNAQIAQLVEQRTENPRVTGSIPVLGIKTKEALVNAIVWDLRELFWYREF